jgi:hypothetical protein
MSAPYYEQASGNGQAMSDEERVALALGPGWFVRACAAVERDIAHWPEWRRQCPLVAGGVGP